MTVGLLYDGESASQGEYRHHASSPRHHERVGIDWITVVCVAGAVLLAMLLVKVAGVIARIALTVAVALAILYVAARAGWLPGGTPSWLPG